MKRHTKCRELLEDSTSGTSQCQGCYIAEEHDGELVNWYTLTCLGCKEEDVMMAWDAA